MSYFDNDGKNDKLYFSVPYELKETAIKFGARYCPTVSMWYVSMDAPRQNVMKLHDTPNIRVYKQYSEAESYNGRKGANGYSRKEIYNMFEDKEIVPKTSQCMFIKKSK